MTFAPSGSQVAACGMFAATVPPVTSTWYQRGAAKPLVLPLRTVCVVHKDSTPPMFVYWFCIIARIWSTSRALPPSDGALGTVALGQLVAAIGVSGPVTVEREMLFQPTWNLYTVSAFKKFHDETK